MKILADENIDAPIVAFLRGEGHDVLWIMEFARGSKDVDILQSATAEGRIIVTFDHDFGELVFRQGHKALGIVLLRLIPSTPGALLESFKTAWFTIVDRVIGNFVVITEQRIRIRPLSSVAN